MPTESDKQLCAHLLDLRCHSKDGHKIMLDEYTFGVLATQLESNGCNPLLRIVSCLGLPTCTQLLQRFRPVRPVAGRSKKHRMVDSAACPVYCALESGAKKKWLKIQPLTLSRAECASVFTKSIATRMEVSTSLAVERWVSRIEPPTRRSSAKSP